MNVNIQKSTMTTEVTFSADKKHRYLLTKQWNKSLPTFLIIMLYPTDFTDELTTDLTTLFTINQGIKLESGCIQIANLFSCCDSGTNGKNLMECTDKINDNTILNAAKISNKIIIATGRNTTNKAVTQRKAEVLQLLSAYKDKTFSISDKNGNTGYHPLSPKIRNNWILVKIDDFEPVENTKKKD